MKTISINWNCLKSIKQAEKLKTKYENLGYTLYSQTSNTLTYKTNLK